MEYELDAWEGGTLVSPAKVDLTTGIVTPAVYEGNTPITPERLEIMNQGIKKLYEEGAISKDIYIGSEEEAPEEAKIIIDSNQMATPINIEQMIDNKLSTETQQDVTTDSDAVKCGYKVDGKDVYVKRINIGVLPNATFKDVSSDLSDITINKLEGVGIRTTDSLTIAIPYSAPNFLVAAMYVSSTNVVRITSQADMSSYVGYMNVYFTYNEEV